MCGLVGAFTPCQKPDLSLLAHRGPDSRGIWEDEDVILGHCRLKILDLSKRGAQPMVSNNGRFILTYNGEIYNFKEIRATLEEKGHKFLSNSDTEVFLNSYEEWGNQAFDHMNGMFAFAVWDKSDKKMVLGRDRFGVKPLAYYFDENSFFFASEIKAILQMKGSIPEIDQGALSQFFTYSYISSPATIYKNMFKVEPGSLITVSKAKGKLRLQEKKWYTLKPAHPSPFGSYEESKKELRNLLTEAVRRRLVSEVPLGAFLSGGIDSSIIVGLMARLSGTPVKTYSIGYKNNSLFDETRYARQVADFNDCQHTEIKIDYNDALSVIPKVLDCLDEPFGDSSAIPTYILSREVGKSITVALSGDGADEIFGGYRKYSGEYYYSLYSRVPKWAGNAFLKSISFLPASKNNKFSDLIRKAKKFTRGIAKEPWLRHFRWMEIAESDAVSGLMKGVFFNPELIVKNRYLQCQKLENINKILFTDIHTCLPNDMLVKVDSMSMANSLEVRSPFLDFRVVEEVMKMPGQFKIEKTCLKKILKETFHDILPAHLVNRPKQGFEIPVGEWFRNELKELFFDTLVKEDGMVSYEKSVQIY
ncbi:MAG: asparagine synthase (glutamine-hydrolyzing), partial [Nitrospinota bacterium]